MEAVTFSDVYAQCYHLLEPDRVVFLKARVDRRREEPGLVVDEVIPIESAAESLTETVKIVVQDAQPREDGSAFNGEFAKLKELLRHASSRANGKAADVVLQLHQAGTCVQLKLNGLRVGVDTELPGSVEHLLTREGAGHARCELLGPRKINPEHVSRDMIHRETDAQPAELTFSMHDDGGESIDRY